MPQFLPLVAIPNVFALPTSVATGVFLLVAFVVFCIMKSVYDTCKCIKDVCSCLCCCCLCNKKDEKRLQR